jgi:hypothetical protein
MSARRPHRWPRGHSASTPQRGLPTEGLFPTHLQHQGERSNRKGGSHWWVPRQARWPERLGMEQPFLIWPIPNADPRRPENSAVIPQGFLDGESGAKAQA